MKVAVAQVELHAGQRSRNLGSVIRAVVQASEHEPAPDLIVLPGACDFGSAGADTGRVTPAMCQGFVETLGALAREWGVWIAAGHTTLMTTGTVSSAVLLDPDGDVWLRLPADCQPQEGDELISGGDGSAVLGDGLRIVARCTALGTVALQARVVDEAGFETGAIDLIVVPLAAGGQGGDSAAAGDGGDLARSARACVCIARSVGEEGDACSGPADVSGVFDLSGRRLAEAQAGRPGIIFAELEIEPPAG